MTSPSTASSRLRFGRIAAGRATTLIHFQFTLQQSSQAVSTNPVVVSPVIRTLAAKTASTYSLPSEDGAVRPGIRISTNTFARAAHPCSFADFLARIDLAGTPVPCRQVY